MEISVVIPFYNSDEFITDAVNSALSQTLLVKEIIIVNDGSKSSCREILDRFEDPVRVVHLKENCGISVARNTGARHATGEWIAFLDSDDMWMKDKLAQQKQFLQAHPELNVCHTGVEVFKGDQVIAQYVNKPDWLALKDAIMIAQVLPSAMLIRRAVFEDVGMFDTKTPASSDRELTIRLIQAGEKIGCINKSLTRLRREDHGNISSQWKPKLRGHLYILRKHFALFRKEKLVRPYLRWTFQHASKSSTGATRVLFKCLARVF
jgi:glycosyltransferase involved in cell wall biosynthesis